MAFGRFDLTNRTALITGAAGLLGREHSFALLQSGASVILSDIVEESMWDLRNDLVKDFDEKKIHTQIMDVTKEDSVNNIVDWTRTSNIRVDILINNAAIDPKVQGDEEINFSRLEAFPVDQWHLQVAVGLTGAFLCSKAFGGLMASDGRGGVIVNIASDLSVISPDQRLYKVDGLPPDTQPVKPVSYSVIKAGLVGLTRYLSTYWADRGVRCNALSPGGVFNGQSEKFVDRLNALVPMARMAKPSEYREALQFLCSDASSYMNGHNLVLDGGRSVW